MTAFEMRWSPDGRWIGVGSADGVWIFDAEQVDAEPYHYAEGALVYVVAFDPVRPYAAFAPGDGEQVRVIEIETGAEVFAADASIGYDEFSSVFYDLGYSDDGQYLSVLNTSMVYALDAATGEMVLIFPNTASVPSYAGSGWMTSLDYGSGSETLLVSDWSAHLFVYDIASRKNTMIHSLDINDGEGYRLERFEIIPETDSILLLGWGALYTYDLAANTMTPLADLGDLHVDGFDLSPDGAQVAVGAGTSWYLYDLVDDRQVGVFESDFSDTTISERIYSLAFSPDGDRVATLQTDGQLKIWDIATGEIIAQLGAFSGGVSQKWG
ncbi:MAG: WD40 repeat domain-containing protein [Anaerolineae bacterium]|nr:WD40 repeat domain-containing protein [Anaerolineae bacterium]